MPKDNPLTIGQLTRYIGRKFDADPYLSQRNLWVVGELTDYRPSSRHQYFAIKDDTEGLAPKDQYKIKAVMFQSAFAKVPFDLENGMKILVRGRVAVYPNRGEYQLYVEQLEEVGTGSLQVAFQQMYQKLKAEGLFDLPKRSIPPFPKRVAIVTSNDAAVKHDMITTFRRRNPLIQLVFYPTKVQGNDAAPMIARQIKRVNETGNFDTLIVARGGGSRGDLWPFNEEVVGRAIAASEIPVISSVGHETDTTIADLAADDRQATPTAAAVKASAWELVEIKAELKRSQLELINGIQAKLKLANQTLRHLRESYPLSQPERLIERPLQQVDDLKMRLIQFQVHRLQAKHEQLQQLDHRLQLQSPVNGVKRNQLQLQHLVANLKQVSQLDILQRSQWVRNLVGRLDALSPLKVLERGYSYATRDNQVISAQQLQPGDQLNLHFYDGNAEVTVDKVRKED
ncbi:MAG TPA: exodeoxyribonuclease VII large subunit [Candidatus Limosilactobacillus faecipullorum]|nr:exodeoxyribonuclease VII large subunit [Candidatus Limosilactobacillus faecipullorum]